MPRTESGLIHYDAETSTRPVERIITFIDYARRVVTLRLMIPMRIVEMLSTTDWDQCQIAVKEEWKKIQREEILKGNLKKDSWIMASKIRAVAFCCEFLYSRFTDEQMRRGNDRWKVPETMQGKANNPEDDALLLKKYGVSE